MNWTLIMAANRPVGIINESNKRVCSFKGEVKVYDARLMQYAPELRELLTELCFYVMDCEREDRAPTINSFHVRMASELLNKI